MIHSKAYISSLGGYQTIIEGENLHFTVEDGGFLHIDSVKDNEGTPVACFIPNSWRDVRIEHAEGSA